jgi:MFS family permease
MTQQPPVAAGAVRPARRALFAAYAALVAATQVLWLSLAPVTTQVDDLLGVSEGAIGQLVVVNSVVFVLLSVPAGRWTDRRFTAAVGAGAVLTALGAVLRAVAPTSYAGVLAGQVVLSIGQPLVLAATTKVAVRWFPEAERTTAIAVASAAQFVGILLAATTAQPLLDAGGPGLLLGAHAAFTVVAALGTLVALRLPPAFAVEATAPPSLRLLLRDRVLILLAGLVLVGVGLFNALATWLDSILTDLGAPGTGGTLIATTTVAGIVGATVVPGWAARTGRRRTVLVAAAVASVVAFPLVAVAPGPVAVGVVLAGFGFVLLAGMPVALEWSELEAGPQRAATATNLLLLAGNVGGAVYVSAVQAVVGDPYLALGALAVLALPALAVTLRLPAAGPVRADDGRSRAEGLAA